MSDPKQPSANPTAEDVDHQKSSTAQSNGQKSKIDSPAKLTELLDSLQLQQLLSGPGSSGKAKHEFWDTQPVPKEGEKITQDGVIEPARAPEELRREPYPLQDDLKWSPVDVNNESEMTELYKLLTENYVEDDDAMFRFDYSPAFLLWALCPPGWNPDWHVGIRATDSNKLVAFISGISIDMRVRKSTHRLVEINFLCVHKQLRAKRMAPVLIQEITRRVHLTGVFRAVYTAGVVLPKPVAVCRYYHRTLNPMKLLDTGFAQKPSGMTMKGFQLRYALPKSTKLRLRLMQPEDAGKVLTLLNRYLKRMDLAVVFKSTDELRHWMLHRDGVIWSYVVEDNNGAITDVVSFYSIPSTVIDNKKHKTVRCAYQFYYATDVIFQPGGEELLGERLRVLFKDALIKAKEVQFDVFNCLNLMDNQHILEPLKFGPGDGNLNYYLYNWRCRDVPTDKVGLLML